MNALRSILNRLPGRQLRPRVVSVTSRPEQLKAVLVPGTLAAKTIAHLQAGGARGCEEFAFWSGHITDSGVAVVSRAFHPHTVQGHGHVMIDDDDQLLAMTDLVHEQDELVICQLHTHPRQAFHSSADDEGAYTDDPGFLSIVLPSFGSEGLTAAEVFRRTESGWVYEDNAAESGLVRVFSDVLCYEGDIWRAS